MITSRFLCLLLQLKREGREDTQEAELIANHLDLLGAHKYDDIAKAMGLSIDIKPNPALVFASVDYTLPISTEKAELQLINAEGKIVYSQKVSGTQGQITIDVRSYKSGAYIFRLQASEYSLSESLIIQ